MPDDKATVARPRTKAAITAEMDAAKAKLQVLQPLIEAEAERLNRYKQRLAHANNRWRVERPDEPFDPGAHSPPLVWTPKSDAEANQQEFHRLHYVIKELEDELAALAAPKPTIKS